MTGIDYSENAALLGKSLFAHHASGSGECKFVPVDFLDPNHSTWFRESPKFDLLVDKGTFDAISLKPTEGIESSSRTETIRGLASTFKDSLQRLFEDSDSARFVITSCNWTKEELTVLFAPEFEVVQQIDHPSFSFAGSSGQVVTTLIFKSNININMQ